MASYFPNQLAKSYLYRGRSPMSEEEKKAAETPAPAANDAAAKAEELKKKLEETGYQFYSQSLPLVNQR